jgi:hypothetical protein
MAMSQSITGGSKPVAEFESWDYEVTDLPLCYYRGRFVDQKRVRTKFTNISSGTLRSCLIRKWVFNKPTSGAEQTVLFWYILDGALNSYTLPSSIKVDKNCNFYGCKTQLVYQKIRNETLHTHYNKIGTNFIKVCINMIKVDRNS